MPTMHVISQRDFQQCGVCDSNHSNEGLQPTMAMTHNNAAVAASAQFNLQVERTISIAGPLIEFSHSNGDQTANIPVAFDLTIPTDDDSYRDKNVCYTTKQMAVASTKEWHDRGKLAALKAGGVHVGQDEFQNVRNKHANADEIDDKCTSKKLPLFDHTKVWCRTNKYAVGRKEEISLPPTNVATKDNNSTSRQPTKYKIAIAGPLIEFTSSNRDQTAKLPLAFGFSIPSDDACSDKNNCYTSKQMALAATKEWYDKGKIASLDVEERHGIQFEGDGRNNHVDVDADEFDNSDSTNNPTLRGLKRVRYPNKNDFGTIANNNSISKTLSISSAKIGCDQGESDAAREMNNVLENHDTTKTDNEKGIIRFQRSAILALHVGVEDYLVGHFHGTKCVARRTKGSGNQKKRKYQSGKENGCNKPTPTPRTRPVATLVEVSDCPPGLPNGWTSETYRRASGKSAGDTDTYWYTPQQKLKFRSKTNIARFIEILNTPGIDGDETAAWKVFRKSHSS